MTYLLARPEVLGFPSDDLISTPPTHDDILDDSKLFNHYGQLDPFGPLSPSMAYDAEQAYEIIAENKAKSCRDGLKLRLRMSNSVCLGPGSVGSSPSDVTSDSEVLNVEDFLNLPSHDYVTLEESKQVHYIAPSPAYSMSSTSTDPSPLHSAFSPRETPAPIKTPKASLTKRKISNSDESPTSQKNSRKTVVQLVPENQVLLTKNQPIRAQYFTHVTYTDQSDASKTSSRSAMRKYNEQAELLMKNREREVIAIEKKESANKLKQGAVIGSMERGPRMFGVRYGPCDRPQNMEPVEDPKLLVSSVTSTTSVVTNFQPYINTSNIQSQVSPASSCQSSVPQSMVMNQQVKLSANSRVHKLPAYKHTSLPTNVTPDTAGKRSRQPSERSGPDSPRQWSCPVPKAKIELPPYRPHKQLSKNGNCKRTGPSKCVIDLFYQKHLYCSVDKPLFESDPEVLKLSETYQLMLNTFLSLESQRVTALKDLDKLENLKVSAQKRPYKFIKQLQKGDIVFPQRQRVAKLPEVNITYRNKDIDLFTFKAPSGQMVSRHSEEFTNKTRLKKEDY